MVADQLSRLCHEDGDLELPLNENFPNEQLFSIQKLMWYAGIVNYLARKFLPQDWSTYIQALP